MLLLEFERRRARIKQGDLARRIGVSQPTLYAWEKGSRTPPWEQAKVLAEVLSMDPVDIVECRPVPPLARSVACEQKP